MNKINNYCGEYKNSEELIVNSKKYKNVRFNIRTGLAHTHGITLISLVITIIILIILAGVAINLSLGENGIFRRAKEARDKYLTAEEQEQRELNELYEQLNRENEPENTPETNAGTRVKLPNNWVTISPNYVSTEDGKVVKKMTISSTVYAISGGKGVTVPVPEGFYYVGGDIDTGIVISDARVDENKYLGKTEKVKDLEENEYTRAYVGKEDLVGNQFVWIESDFDSTNDVINYEKTDFYTIEGEYDTTIPGIEIGSIKKYNGFYIGRYEAGLATTILETKEIVESSSNVYDKVGIPQSKEGLIPWNFISWTNAKLSSEKMYEASNSVISTLITGTQWDTTLNTIVKKEKNIMVEDLKGSGSSKFGNYYNNSIDYTGRKSNSESETGVFGKKQINEKTATDKSDLLTTGASETCKIYNIYDLAGNLMELTDEVSFYGGNTSIQYKELRGGGHNNNAYEFPVGVRHGSIDVNFTGYDVGFRVTLYIK